MDLTIDFGTSSGKLGLFDEGELVDKATGITLDTVSQSIYGHTIRNVIVSSVSAQPSEILEKVKYSGKAKILSSDTRLPIHLDYSTPNTLGADRIAAVVGAFAKFPNQNVLVIDAGTAITYDLLTADGVYKGGSISPGIELKFKALHNYTVNLPLMERVDKIELTGDSTAKSIQSGVINGTIAEMREISRMYRDKMPHLQLVICGGDAEFYFSRLENEAEYAPNLVLFGLKTILDYNV